jgi:hypothetical protein
MLPTVVLEMGSGFDATRERERGDERKRTTYGHCASSASRGK